MLNKKGLTKETLIVLVLAAVFIVALLWLARGTVLALDRSSSVELCRSSVNLGSWEHKTMIPFLKIDSPVDINCKTRYFEIKEDKIQGEGTTRLFDKDDEEYNKNLLKEMIFREMGTCWYQFGAGRVAVQKAIDSAETACIICSEIIPGKKEWDLTNLYSYANNHEYRQGQKYMSYLTGEGRVPEYRDATGSVLLDEPHYVVFQVANSRVAGAKIDSGIVECTIDGVRGAQNGENAQKIGCGADGTVEGINFGKVMGLPDDDKNDGTATVRLTPASGITSANCEKLA